MSAPPRLWRNPPLLGWMFYDFGSSAFNTIIITFIFSVYFAKSVAPTPEEGGALWGMALAAAGLASALIAPVIGALADRYGRHSGWLMFFTGVFSMATLALSGIKPDAFFVPHALAFLIIGLLAFELAQVIYAAMLPPLVVPSLLGRASAYGWGLGYLGGLLTLAAALLLFIDMHPPFFGLVNERDGGAVRAVCTLTGLWCLVFALPLILLFPKTPLPPKPRPGLALRQALQDIGASLQLLPATPGLLRFLIASAFWRDGLNMLFQFGGIFAATAFGMSLKEVLLFAIALNVSAGVGCALAGGLDDRFGAKPVLIGSLLLLIIFGSIVVLTQDVTIFWAGALILGLGVGPAQSSARALLLRLSPPENRTELCGLYALTGRAVSFLGPLCYAGIVSLTQDMRAGMASILLFFLFGLLMLLSIRAPRIQPTRA